MGNNAAVQQQGRLTHTRMHTHTHAHTHTQERREEEGSRGRMIGKVGGGGRDLGRGGVRGGSCCGVFGGGG